MNKKNLQNSMNKVKLIEMYKALLRKSLLRMNLSKAFRMMKMKVSMKKMRSGILKKKSKTSKLIS